MAYYYGLTRLHVVQAKAGCDRQTNDRIRVVTRQ